MLRDVCVHVNASGLGFGGANPFGIQRDKFLFGQQFLLGVVTRGCRIHFRTCLIRHAQPGPGKRRDERPAPRCCPSVHVLRPSDRVCQ
jgi:hypothetical protein